MTNLEEIKLALKQYGVWKLSRERMVEMINFLISRVEELELCDPRCEATIREVLRKIEVEEDEEMLQNLRNAEEALDPY